MEIPYSERYEKAQDKINALKRETGSPEEFRAAVKALCKKTYGKENFEIYADVLDDMSERSLSYQFIKRMREMGHAAPVSHTEYGGDDESPEVVQPDTEVPSGATVPADLPTAEDDEADSNYNDEEEQEVEYESRFLNFDEFTNRINEDREGYEDDNSEAGYIANLALKAFDRILKLNKVSDMNDQRNAAQSLMVRLSQKYDID